MSRIGSLGQPVGTACWHSLSAYPVGIPCRHTLSAYLVGIPKKGVPITWGAKMTHGQIYVYIYICIWPCVIVAKHMLTEPFLGMPTRYADRVCRQGMPTNYADSSTRKGQFGKEFPREGYADNPMPTTYADNLCRHPMPTTYADRLGHRMPC